MKSMFKSKRHSLRSEPDSLLGESADVDDLLGGEGQDGADILSDDSSAQASEMKRRMSTGVMASPMLKQKTGLAGWNARRKSLLIASRVWKFYQNNERVEKHRYLRQALHLWKREADASSQHDLVVKKVMSARLREKHLHRGFRRFKFEAKVRVIREKYENSTKVIALSWAVFRWGILTNFSIMCLKSDKTKKRHAILQWKDLRRQAVATERLLMRLEPFRQHRRMYTAWNIWRSNMHSSPACDKAFWSAVQAAGGMQGFANKRSMRHRIRHSFQRWANASLDSPVALVSVKARSSALIAAAAWREHCGFHTCNANPNITSSNRTVYEGGLPDPVRSLHAAFKLFKTNFLTAKYQEDVSNRFIERVGRIKKSWVLHRFRAHILNSCWMERVSTFSSRWSLRAGLLQFRKNVTYCERKRRGVKIAQTHCLRWMSRDVSTAFRHWALFRHAAAFRALRSSQHSSNAMRHRLAIDCPNFHGGIAVVMQPHCFVRLCCLGRCYRTWCDFRDYRRDQSRRIASVMVSACMRAARSSLSHWRGLVRAAETQKVALVRLGYKSRLQQLKAGFFKWGMSCGGHIAATTLGNVPNGASVQTWSTRKLIEGRMKFMRMAQERRSVASAYTHWSVSHRRRVRILEKIIHLRDQQMLGAVRKWRRTAVRRAMERARVKQRGEVMRPLHGDWVPCRHLLYTMWFYKWRSHATEARLHRTVLFINDQREFLAKQLGMVSSQQKGNLLEYSAFRSRTATSELESRRMLGVQSGLRLNSSTSSLSLGTSPSQNRISYARRSLSGSFK